MATRPNTPTRLAPEAIAALPTSVLDEMHRDIAQVLTARQYENRAAWEAQGYGRGRSAPRRRLRTRS